MVSWLVTIMLMVLFTTSALADQCGSAAREAWTQIENARALTALTCDQKRKKCEDEFKDNDDIKNFIRK